MLKKTFQVVDRVFRWFEEWSLFIAVMVALCVALANVILRKATADVNLYWSDEVVRKTIYFSTYIGCIAAVRGRSLIRIDALPQIFPKLKMSLTMIANLAVLVFSVLMVWLGWQMTVLMYEDEFAKTASLQIPEWIFYAVLPLMGAMMFIRTLIVMVEDWKEFTTG
ncbi:TRAP-type C4-dicarboxylate transport system permease small subunit [Geothermobacter ehrlichii]|uniref:TRAP-type C4-dicarboxylate transport system permease small subunit n=1 Tax=Geothermobacter ehrlichii TaxID=213224 RepID=A0A5D3WFM8_9BACT|nr:TRAP transporter small permease subunit [Geothermobacter ehrlichii]TYO94663.1 TRAP-type C4-dicarboxylate transport system permease small subunit [Geothermobacter ehrlichii]